MEQLHFLLDWRYELITLSISHLYIMRTPSVSHPILFSFSLHGSLFFLSLPDSLRRRPPSLATPSLAFHAPSGALGSGPNVVGA